MALNTEIRERTDKRASGQRKPAAARVIVSVDEAAGLHPRQWILMTVKHFDAHDRPVAGEIIGAWPPSEDSERAISREFARLARAVDGPGDAYYLFEASQTGVAQEYHEATGRLVARLATVIGERRARRRR